MKKKIALVFGITGQDGSYLTEFLLSKKYFVYGVKRRTSLIHTTRIDHIYQDRHSKPNLILKYGDVTDFSNVFKIISDTKPDEIYNLAAQSNVGVSFELAEYTAQTDSIGTLRILEALRILDKKKKIKFYQASTSEIFGNSQDKPYNEKSRFAPVSPYGTAKLYSYWITKNYREAYSMYAANGILFNHESPRRGETFVTRKITRGLSRIALGLEKKLFLGNLDAKRDWGHAKDYVEAMWLMLQQEKPADYVIGTGEQHSVEDFLSIAFNHVGLNFKDFVKIDKNFFRPAEVDTLLADASTSSKKLGWKPKISFKELVIEMVESDLKNVKDKIY